MSSVLNLSLSRAKSLHARPLFSALSILAASHSSDDGNWTAAPEYALTTHASQSVQFSSRMNLSEPLLERLLGMDTQERFLIIDQHCSLLVKGYNS